MAAASLFFVDTNVLLYALDGASPEKQTRALAWRDALWERGAGRLSWQVLNEFYVNATRKLGAPPATARQVVEAYATWEPVGYGIGILHRAWHWADKAGVSYWDSLILASAEAAGCSYLLSEDLQTGLKFGDLRIVDPFACPPEDLIPR